MLSDVMLSEAQLVIRLSDVILSEAMLCVIRHIVIMQTVVAPRVKAGNCVIKVPPFHRLS
jgi:hypothetical protein